MDKMKLLQIREGQTISEEEFRTLAKFLSPNVKLLAKTYQLACKAYAERSGVYGAKDKKLL